MDSFLEITSRIMGNVKVGNSLTFDPKFFLFSISAEVNKLDLKGFFLSSSPYCYRYLLAPVLFWHHLCQRSCDWIPWAPGLYSVRNCGLFAETTKSFFFNHLKGWKRDGKEIGTLFFFRCLSLYLLTIERLRMYKRWHYCDKRISIKSHCFVVQNVFSLLF